LRSQTTRQIDRSRQLLRKGTLVYRGVRLQKFQIWSDNALEAEWFQSLDKRLNNSSISIIQGRGSNSEIVDQLVIYDRPDIILLDHAGTPILVLEKTREVPTGHNVGQRVARLIRAAEFGLPTFFFLPFDARKHGKYSSMCTINTRLIKAMLRVGEIHDCPVLPVNWPCDDDGELVISGKENAELSKLISATLDSHEGTFNETLDSHKELMERELELRESAYPPYGELPKSAKIDDTKSFLDGLGLLSNLNAPGLLERETSLVYKMEMTPDNCKRQDPYTGMQFIYDYGWLREGPSPKDRSRNLILHVPLVNLETWMKNNPDDYRSKSCNWYLTADAIVLSDGIIRLENWPLHHVR
jgi:hypothetical protein